MDKGRLEINEQPESFVDEEIAMLDDGLPGLDFSRSTIILTSNIGSSEITNIKKGRGNLGFDLNKESHTQVDIKQAGLEAVKKYWEYMPEFLDRLDSIVVFKSLTEKVVSQLIDKFLDEYNNGREKDSTILMATEELKDWIMSQVEPSQAGRSLKRKIEKLVITPAAEVKMKMPKGMPLIADVSRDEPKRVVFWVSKRMVGSASKPVLR